MSEEKTFEIFAEIAELLRSARSEDPDGWQFHHVILRMIAGNVREDIEAVETILIKLSELEQ